MGTLANSVRLMGHLGADPEIKTFGERKMARFSLATTDFYVNPNGEKVKETQWHKVVVWGKSALNVEKNYTKGAQVLLEGKLTTRSYDDKQGKTLHITEVVANRLILIKQSQ